MSNEKYNKDWKMSLQELSVLPGEEQPDMSAVWEKLEVRLSGKKNNRKPLFFWLAAASVLTCMLLTILPGKPGKDIVSRQIAQQNKPVDKKEIIKSLSQKQTNDVVIAPMNKKERSAPVLNKISVIKAHPFPALVEPLVAIIIENKDSFIANTIIPEAIKTKPIVFVSLKKKLPVVHINDLEKPVGQIESIAGNNDRQAFRVRLFNRNILQGSSTGNNDNNSGLKIKLPPQN